jgi:hypothetical protein
MGCGSSSHESAPVSDAGVRDSATTMSTTGPTPDDDAAVGQLNAPPSTKLPTLPTLTNVVATEREDSVGIDFDPVDNALDYRVYPLPADGDIAVNSDGSVTVKNAIYRCAGIEQTFDVANNLDSDGGLTPQSADGTGLFTFDANGYAWKTAIAAEPTLGYVFTTAGSGRIPVYALAGYTMDDELGWSESRLKVYTTDATQRQTLIADAWRDDGIAFYVPATPSASTATIYSSQVAHLESGKTWTQYLQYYFTASDMASHAKDTTPPAPAFQVLTATTDGAKPLMAVSYNEGVNTHVELAVGPDRFKRAAYQGAGPLWHLEWSGITQPTTLVVEALSSGCPFQGFLAPTHLNTVAPHPIFQTLSDLQSGSPTGEVFINGQYDGPTSPPVEPGPPGIPVQDASLPVLHASTMSPMAVARSFVSVAPKPHVAADWDWYQGFNVGTDFGTVTTMPRAGSLCPPGSFMSVCGRWQSPIFDFSVYQIDGGDVQVFSYGYLLGQLWEAFDDAAGDTIGKVRFTARQMASVDSDPTKFLHATMSVDTVATGRRYPQLIISDQPAPVQEGFASPNNNSLLFQVIRGPGTRVELQAIHGLVNGKSWDVNNQAPEHQFVPSDFSTYSKAVLTPAQATAAHQGMDRMTRFDAYVSSQRSYFFLDGQPAGCTQYPSGVTVQGPMTVTFGDVMYHEGAPDELVCTTQKPFPFLHEHQCTETKRHFDDLGFKSGVPAPAWNEAQFPCGAY